MAKSSNNTVEQLKAALKEAKDLHNQLVLYVRRELTAMQQRVGLLEECRIPHAQGQSERPERLDQLVQRILPELPVEQILRVQQLIQALRAIQGQLAQQAVLDGPTLKALLTTLDRQVRRQLLALLDSKPLRARLGPQA
jgi:hypothetical protein